MRQLLVLEPGHPLTDSYCVVHTSASAFVDSNPIRHHHHHVGMPILPLFAFHQPILVGATLHHREIAALMEGPGLKNRMILLPEGGPAFFGESAQ